MKKLLGIALLTLLVRFAPAQVLPVDDAGKVAFLEVVKTDSIPAGQLYSNALNWLRGLGYELEEADSLSGRLVAKHAFAVYDKGYVTKKIHGKVNYRVTLELKDNKYRYQFADFVFAYYKENRNFQMIPTGKTKPLEEPTVSGWQKLWENHRKNTALTVEKLIGQLKPAMLFTPKTGAALAKQTKKEDW